MFSIKTCILPTNSVQILAAHGSEPRSLVLGGPGCYLDYVAEVFFTL